MIVWVTVAVLAICGFYGWRAGMVRRVLELVGLVLAILVSARFAAAVTPWLAEHTAMSAHTALLTSYVLVFVVALIAARLLAGALAAVIRWTPLGWLDRLGGAVCGVTIAALLISVGLIAVSQGSGGQAVREAYLRQPVGEAIYHAAPSLYQGARRLFGGQIDELWQRAVELGGKLVEEGENSAAGDS